MNKTLYNVTNYLHHSVSLHKCKGYPIYEDEKLSLYRDYKYDGVIGGNRLFWYRILSNSPGRRSSITVSIANTRNDSSWILLLRSPSLISILYIFLLIYIYFIKTRTNTNYNISSNEQIPRYRSPIFHWKCIYIFVLIYWFTSTKPFDFAIHSHSWLYIYGSFFINLYLFRYNQCTTWAEEVIRSLVNI